MADDFDPKAYLKSLSPPPADTPAVATPAAEPEFDPKAYLSGHYDTLASDQSYDPTDRYRSNPSQESMTEAREVFKRRAKQPTDFGKAVVDFGKGAAPAVLEGVKGLAKGAMAIGGNLLTELGFADNVAQQERAQRENAAALQLGALKGKETGEGLARNIGRLFGHRDSTLSDSEIEERIRGDAANRSIEDELKGGHVIDAPGFKGVAQGIEPGTFGTRSPEQLAKEGAPIRPENIENESFVGDPTTFAAEGLGHVAGPLISRTVTAPVLRTAGKAFDALGAAGNTVRGARAAIGPAAILLTGHGSPLAAGATFIAEKAAQHLAPAAGQLLKEAGAEAAGQAPAVGQSLLRKAVKSGATGAVTGATLGIPFAAAAQSPEEAGAAIGGGFGLGAALGTIGGVKESGRTDRIAKAAQLAKEGSRINYGTGWEDAAHAQDIQKLSPEDQQLVNIYRARFNGFTDPNGIPIQVYALSGDNYAKAVSENGGGSAKDTRGFVSPDGTKVVLNVDAANRAPGMASGTLGHELGGHATEFLADVAKSHDLATLQDSIRSAMYGPDGKPVPVVQRFIDRYKSALESNGATPEYIDNLTKIDPRYFEKEFLAEHAAKILNGRAISDFNLPKPIAERLTQGASRWLEKNGIKNASGGKIGFDGQEIHEITRQLGDLLYHQGELSEKLRAERVKNGDPEPSMALEYQRLQQQTATPPDPSWPKSQVDAYNAAMARKAEIEKQFGVTTQSGDTPVSAPPSSQESAMAHSDAKVAVLEQMADLGMSKREAAAAIKKAVDKLGPITDTDALAKAAMQEAGWNPAPIEPVPTPNATEPTPSPAVPPVDKEPTPEPAVATALQEQRPKPTTNRPPPKTREELKQIAKEAGDAAEADVRGKRTSKQKSHTLEPAIEEARAKAELKAMALAHAESHPSDTDLVSLKTDKFGRQGIYGTRIDPTDPFHQELLDRAGYNSSDKAKLRKIAARFNQPTSIEYLSAPDDPRAIPGFESMSKREQVKALRERAQKQSTASNRAAGESPVRQSAKSIIPQSISFNSGTNSFTVDGFSPDKFLANASKVIPWLKSKGIETYSSAKDPQLIKDLNGYAENHKNGWKGDGSGPIQGSNLTDVTPTEGYSPHLIPKDRFDALNAMIGDESASLKTDEGKAKGGNADDRLARKEKQVLAASNSPFHDPDTGEVNRIRDLMKRDGGFTFKTDSGENIPRAKILEQANESIRPDLIEEIGEPKNIESTNLRLPQETAKLASRITGTPRSEFAAAGFQPDESDPARTRSAVIAPRHKNTFALHQIDADKLDSAWAKDGSYYVPKGGGGESEIKGRRDNFKEWLKANPDAPIHAPEVTVSEDGKVSFEDGRSRARVMLDSGRKSIPIGIDNDSIENAKKNGLIPNFHATESIKKPAEPETQQAVSFQPDTGLPEEGETPSERLTREAEAAGVVLKTEDLKKLIRGDSDTMARIRSRIQQNTGKPARFQPDIFRADSSKPGAARHWTEDRNAAELYRHNPGFGGENLYSAKKPEGNMLQLSSRSEWRNAAKQVGETLDEDRPYDLVYRPAFQKMLRENGYSGVTYEDDFPEGVTSHFFLDDPGARQVKGSNSNRWKALSNAFESHPKAARPSVIEQLGKEISRREGASPSDARENSQILARDFEDHELREMLNSGPDGAWNIWERDVLGIEK